MDETEPITLESADIPAARRRSGRSSLTLVAGGKLGTVHWAEGTETRLGRGDECELTIIGEGISRVHAKIVTGAEGLATLIDLDSTNGTYLNGVRMIAEPLRDQDRIQLARHVAMIFRYEYVEGEIDAATPRPTSRSVEDVLASVGSTLDNLARLYENKGRWDKAIETLRRSLDIHRKKLGDGHDAVSAIAANLERLERQRPAQ